MFVRFMRVFDFVLILFRIASWLSAGKVRSPGSDISLFILLRFIAILIRFIEL